MDELKTEPLAMPTEPAETPKAPQPTESATAPAQSKTGLPAGLTWAANAIQKSPGKLALYAVLVFLGLFAVEFLAQIPRWMREAHARRVHRIIDTVTPDSVMLRCGQPLDDVTKDLYPMISRRMTYNSALPGNPGKVILLFSRTAEEHSDWVYSSMRDESSATSYNTPDEQMAALPCLASVK